MEQKNGEIVLFGYGAFIAEEGAGISHLDELMKDPNTKIADVRPSPFSSSDFPVWHGRTLKQRYGYDADGKSRYVHIPELGNLNYRKEDRDKGFLLQDRDTGLSRLILALSFGWRLVLLCGCRDYAHCHRSLVAQLLLAELPNVKITHVEELERAETPDTTTAMKALSIQQPWTWLIASGFKTVENREWTDKYRGPVLLHAGGKVDGSWFEDGELSYSMMSHYGILDYGIPERKADYATGAIIGVAELVDVVTEMDNNKWFCGTYGFVFSGARLFREPIPYKGQLNLFNVPMSIVADALKQIELPEIEQHVPAPIVVEQPVLFEVAEPARWRDI